MCSTCNFKQFQPVVISSSNQLENKLEQPLGFGSLVIRCDPNGTNYTLSVKNETNSSYKIYRCPTCGSKLY